MQDHRNSTHAAFNPDDQIIADEKKGGWSRRSWKVHSMPQSHYAIREVPPAQYREEFVDASLSSYTIREASTNKERDDNADSSILQNNQVYAQLLRFKNEMNEDIIRIRSIGTHLCVILSASPPFQEN